MIVNRYIRAKLNTIGTYVLFRFWLLTVRANRECSLVSGGVEIMGDLREMPAGLVTLIPLVLQ
jgi:hypothetical protein